MALSISELMDLVTIWTGICLIAYFFDLRARNKKLMQENRRLKRAMK